MDCLLARLLFAKYFFHNAVGFSASTEENLEHIKKLIAKIARHGLKIKVCKCDFAKKQGFLLVHLAERSSVRVNPKNTDVIQNKSRPKSRTELRSSLGIARYYRRFFHGFACVFALLHATTSSKNRLR